MNKVHILVVDDEINQRETLGDYLKTKYRVTLASNGAEALGIIRKDNPDIVISDFKMPEMTGGELLSKAKEINPNIQVIILTAFGTIDTAVSIMKNGAWDFITKPIDLDQLDHTLQQITEHLELTEEVTFLKEELAQLKEPVDIIYESSQMKDIMSLIQRISGSDPSMLVTGETGTGKEVIANLIHTSSERRDKPFVAVNCGALQSTVIESELFGHEKGAFTGAHQQRKGRFEIANGGTLFLDEIGDLPYETQVKLLRVLQEKKFERLGGNTPIETDVRIIAATNQNLEELIAEGKFREDLLYRLNVISIHIPPLRERKADILPLAKMFIEKSDSNKNGRVKGIENSAKSVLEKYNFPGNIRELKNIVERAVLLTRHSKVQPEDFPIESKTLPMTAFSDKTLPEATEELEKSLIEKALKEFRYNQTKSAEKLGISERVLRYKIGKYNLK